MHNKMIARHQIAPKGDFMPEKLWGFRAEEEQAAAWKGSRPGEPGSHLQSSVKTFFPFILSIRNCLQCQQSWSMLPRNKKIFKFKVAFFPYICIPKSIWKGLLYFSFSTTWDYDGWVQPSRDRCLGVTCARARGKVLHSGFSGGSGTTGCGGTLLRLCPNL